MNELIMLVGLPASGKSTIAEKYKESGYIVHSSDELRKELLGDVSRQDKNVDIFNELHKRINHDLGLGKNVVYDATNLSYKRRRAFIESVYKFDCNKKAVVMATPYNECIDRDRKREKKVASSVIEKMYRSFTMPSKMEGFDEIEIIHDGTCGETKDLIDIIEKLSFISQDNPNHTITIGEHCDRAFNICCTLTNNEILHASALFHDIGKKFCKQFKDSNNKSCDIAHYYNHESVSSYEFLTNSKDNDDMDEVIEVCNYIQYHMRPHTMTTEKSINKFKRFVGEEFYNNLLILHEADKGAR